MPPVTPRSIAATAALLLITLALAPASAAQGTYRNPDNTDLKDTGEGPYPVPYHQPSVQEIAADLTRVRLFLESALPTRIVDRRDGHALSPTSVPIAQAIVERPAAEDFSDLNYTMGVVHSGMLRAAAATGDRRFSDFSARQLAFIGEALPYFRAQAAAFGLKGNSFRPILAPERLDDCGAMTAALIRARLAGVGPDLDAVIRPWSAFIAHRQFRLADGTLARQRPQRESVWADDLYMAVPALAEMGRLTGDRSWSSDAARDALQTASRLFRPAPGLFTHGWSSDNPEAPDFYWGRANGWAMLALCDLLDVLPSDHPDRPKLLALLRAQIRGVAGLQSGEGLWHQMLDRNDSYLETSASAMFTYGIAHAINQGWISPVTYGTIAQTGWDAVAARIDDRGMVQGTCMGTTFGADQVYYYNRPTSPYALHGYGPVLLAGSEIIRLLQNDHFTIKYGSRTYTFVPKA